MQRSHTLLGILTLSAACGSPTERPPSVASVIAPTTSHTQQARLPIFRDAGVPDAPGLPKLVCDADTQPIRAAYPDRAWYCVRADGTRAGPFTTFYPDGAIEIQGRYADGKLDGAWRRHHPAGALAETGTYVAGLRDGVWRQLGPAGNLLGEYTLAHGTGTQRRWLADGSLYSEIALQDGVPHGASRIFDRDGSVIVFANLYHGKPHGKQIAGDKSTLRIEESFVHGVRRGPRTMWRFWALLAEEAYDTKGQLDGAFTLWRDRRVPRVKGTYAHGERTGTWTWTDRGNHEEREGSYAAGEKSGAWREWWAGKLVFQGTFTAGKPDGDFVYFDRRGNELGRFTMVDGTGTMLTFHANGRPATKTGYVDGKLQGAYEELTARGRRIVTGRYLADRKHGTWRETTETGVPTLEQHYKRGLLDGAWKKFVAGKLAVEATYVKGLADGTYTEYRDGKPSLVGQLAAGRRTGTWISYAADGAITLTATYVDGVLDGPWHQITGGAVIDGQMHRGHRAGTWTQTDRAGQTQTVTYPTQ